MIRVGLLGAGSHSRREHIPALERCRGDIELTAICDPRVTELFGFRRHCRSLDELLAVRPDAILAITPVEVTAEIAQRIIAAGIPLLMEKPLGRTLEEARQVCAAAAGKPVMVSMNRRFDPVIVAARQWLVDRPIESARATLVRHNRPAAGFVEDVGLHAVDTLRFLTGRVGAMTLVPNGGHWVETYEVFGPGYHVEAQATQRCRIWDAGKLVVDVPGQGTGTYEETVAFLRAVAGQQPFSPTPADVLASMEALT
jgi:predicted dehydrogenase